MKKKKKTSENFQAQNDPYVVLPYGQKNNATPQKAQSPNCIFNLKQPWGGFL